MKAGIGGLSSLPQSLEPTLQFFYKIPTMNSLLVFSILGECFWFAARPLTASLFLHLAPNKVFGTIVAQVIDKLPQLE